MGIMSHSEALICLSVLCACAGVVGSGCKVDFSITLYRSASDVNNVQQECHGRLSTPLLPLPPAAGSR